MLKKIIESYYFEGFIYLFRFLSNIILIRLLGPELNGKFAYLLAIIGIFNFVNIFSSDIIIYSEAVKKKINSRIIYNNNLIKLFMGFIFIITIFVYLKYIENEFSNLIFFTLVITELLRQIINNYFQFYLQALNRVVKYKFLDLIGYIYLCLAFFILLYLNVTNFLILAILLLTKEIFVSLMCFIKNKDIPFKFNFDLKNIIYSFNFGKYLILPKLTNIAAANITVLILGSSGYYIEAGVLAILARLKILVLFPINAIEPIIRRAYFKFSEGSSFDNLNNFNKAYINLITFYLCSLITFIIINSEIIIIFIFGNDYLYINSFMIIYLFIILINIFIRTSTYLYHANNDTKKLGYFNFIFEILLLILLMIFVPEEIMGFKLFGFGIMGDLYAKYIISLLLFIFMVRYCNKKNYIKNNYKYLYIYFSCFIYCIIFMIFKDFLKIYIHNIIFLTFLIIIFFSFYRFSLKIVKKDWNTVIKNDL